MVIHNLNVKVNSLQYIKYSNTKLLETCIYNYEIKILFVSGQNGLIGA